MKKTIILTLMLCFLGACGTTSTTPPEKNLNLTCMMEPLTLEFYAKESDGLVYKAIQILTVSRSEYNIEEDNLAAVNEELNASDSLPAETTIEITLDKEYVYIASTTDITMVDPSQYQEYLIIGSNDINAIYDFLGSEKCTFK